MDFGQLDFWPTSPCRKNIYTDLCQVLSIMDFENLLCCLYAKLS